MTSDQHDIEPVAHPRGNTARRRVSAPGLRTFLAIADRLDLSTAQRISLLGEPPRSTYHGWVKKAHGGMALTLPLDTLTRISGVLGIHKALVTLFPIEAEAATWLKGPHHGEVFGGQTPIKVMLDGGLDGILTVRRHLETRCRGSRGDDGADEDITDIGDGEHLSLNFSRYPRKYLENDFSLSGIVPISRARCVRKIIRIFSRMRVATSRPAMRESRRKAVLPILKPHRMIPVALEEASRRDNPQKETFAMTEGEISPD